MQEWMWEKENVIRLTIVTGNQTFPYNTTTPAPESTTPTPFLDTLGYDAVQVTTGIEPGPCVLQDRCLLQISNFFDATIFLRALFSQLFDKKIMDMDTNVL